MTSRINCHHRAIAAVGNEDPAAIGMRSHTVRVLPGSNFSDHLLAGDINGVDLAGQFASNIGTAAVSEESDAARAFADQDMVRLLALGNINHINLFGLFGADINPAPIGAEHGMFRVATFHLNARQFLAAGCLN